MRRLTHNNALRSDCVTPATRQTPRKGPHTPAAQCVNARQFVGKKAAPKNRPKPLARAATECTLWRMKHDETLLNATERRVLRGLVERVGILEAVNRLRVGRESIARAVAGMPVRRGTVAILRASLESDEGNHAAG